MTTQLELIMRKINKYNEIAIQWRVSNHAVRGNVWTLHCQCDTVECDTQQYCVVEPLSGDNMMTHQTYTDGQRTNKNTTIHPSPSIQITQY